jgi:hypothetical protein
LTLTTSEPPLLDGTASREGFYLSFGLGHSLTRWLIDVVVADEELRSADTELGLASKVQIGYTLPAGVTLHLSNRLAWSTTSGIGDRSVQLAGLTGVGATYFFNPNAPSVYVSGDLGLSHWARLDDYFNLGFGLCGAAGYEFAEHWSVEQSYCWGTAKEDTLDGDELIGVEGKPFTASFTINYVLY